MVTYVVSGVIAVLKRWDDTKQISDPRVTPQHFYGRMVVDSALFSMVASISGLKG